MDRSKYLGSHAYSAIADCNPFSSAIDVYAQAIGRPLTKENAAMSWGLRLEDPIMDAWAASTGHKITARQVFRQSGIIGGTADGILNNGEGVDAKTTRFRTDEWGEPGTAQVPPYIYCQAQHFCELFGSPRWHIAALFSGQDEAHYIIERDPAIGKQIFDTLRSFWRDHIETETPPPIDGSASAGAFLKAMYPAVERENLLDANEEQAALMREYRMVADELAATEEKEKKLRHAIQSWIKDGKGIQAKGLGKITWGMTKGRATIDLKELKAKAPDVYEEFVKEGKPYRVFRKTWTKG